MKLSKVLDGSLDMTSSNKTANDALQNLRKIGGKIPPTKRSETFSTNPTEIKKIPFDSDPINKSLPSGEAERSGTLEETKYENIRLRIENSLTTQLDLKIENIKSKQGLSFSIIAAIIIGVTFVIWNDSQDKFTSIIERLIKLEYSFSSLIENKTPQPSNTNKHK